MSAVDFLGLVKKAGRLETGEESVAAAARAGRAKVILVASDAGRSTAGRAESSAAAGGCPLVAVPATREELGAVTGRDVVSVAAVTDAGMAAAFVRKLAEADGRFARAAQELSRPDPAGQTPRGRHKREH